MERARAAPSGALAAASSVMFLASPPSFSGAGPESNEPGFVETKPAVSPCDASAAL